MFPSPVESDSDVHNAGEKECVGVDMGSMSNNWSEPGLRANTRQDNSVTQEKGRPEKTGPKKRGEAEQKGEMRRREGMGGASPLGSIDHVNVVVGDSSSLISARVSQSVDQASGSGSSQAHPKLGDAQLCSNVFARGLCGLVRPVISRRKLAALSLK